MKTPSGQSLIMNELAYLNLRRILRWGLSLRTISLEMKTLSGQSLILNELACLNLIRIPRRGLSLRTISLEMKTPSGQSLILSELGLFKFKKNSTPGSQPTHNKLGYEDPVGTVRILRRGLSHRKKSSEMKTPSGQCSPQANFY